MAVPMGSSAGVVIFEGFRRGVASFRVAGVALRDIQTCSGTCRKSFCVAGAILLRGFQKMCCSFRGRRSTLDVSIVIFRGRRSTLDVSCCVSFANRIGRAASSGDKVQIPWQAWHFARCAENWRKPRTKHRFWGCKFSGSKENSQENVDFEATKCEKWRKSRTKCSFWCSYVSRLESLVIPWIRRVYVASCKTCPFVMLPTVKIAGSLVQNAGFSASTCLISSRWFSCGVAVSMGEAGKHILFECVQAGCHVVLRGRRGTLWHSNLFGNVWEISKLEAVSHEMLVFSHPRVSSRVSGFPMASPCLWGKLRTPHSTLHTPHSTIYTLDSTLYTLHSTLYTLHFTLLTPHLRLYTPHSTLYTTLYTFHSSLLTLHFTLHTPHSTLYTPHSTLYTTHSLLYTPHFTLQTFHSTLYTPHFTLLTPDSTIVTLHSTLHTLHFPLRTPHSTLYCTLHTPHFIYFTLLTPHSTLYTPHFTLHTPHSTHHTLHFSLHTPHSTLHTPHYTLYTPHFTLYTPRFPLYSPHFTLHTSHSTLHTLHFTLHTPHSTLYTAHSTLYTLYTPHSTLYTPHSLLHTPHSTLSTPHCRLVTRETCTRLFKQTIAERYCAWLHNHVFWHLYH